MKRALRRSTLPSALYLVFYTHMQPMLYFLTGKVVMVQVLLLYKAYNSAFMAFCHLGSNIAYLNVLNSM